MKDNSSSLTRNFLSFFLAARASGADVSDEDSIRANNFLAPFDLRCLSSWTTSAKTCGEFLDSAKIAVSSTRDFERWGLLLTLARMVLTKTLGINSVHLDVAS